MFKKSGGLISLFLVSSGNIVSTIISSIALIIFSRYLGPSEFGIFSSGFAVMQIIVRVVDLGINTATDREIARYYLTAKKPLAISYMQLVLWLKVIATTIVLAIGLLLATPIAMWLGITDIGIIRIAFITSVGTIAYEYVSLILQSTQSFVQVARLAITQATGKLLFGLILIWQNMLSAGTALALYGLMPLFGALALFHKLPLATIAPPRDWARLSRNLALVARWTAISMLAATFADNIDTLLIQKLLGSYEAGIWGAAGRLAAFASLVGWSMGTVLSVRVARYQSKEHLDEYLKKAKWLALGGAALVLVGVPLAGFGLWLTVGAEYLVGTLPLVLMLVSVAVVTATVPYTALFYLFDRPQYYAYAGVILVLGITVGNWFAIPAYGLVGAGVVKIILRLIILAFTLLYARICYTKYYAHK